LMVQVHEVTGRKSKSLVFQMHIGWPCMYALGLRSKIINPRYWDSIDLRGRPKKEGWKIDKMGTAELAA